MKLTLEGVRVDNMVVDGATVRLSLSEAPPVPVDATPRFIGTTIFDILIGLRVEFDQDVPVYGWGATPAWLGNGTVPCAGVDENYTVYFESNLSLPATITVPERDPALRTRDGGYVAAGVYPVSV
jgi:hypothetical protein